MSCLGRQHSNHFAIVQYLRLKCSLKATWGGIPWHGFCSHRKSWQTVVFNIDLQNRLTATPRSLKRDEHCPGQATENIQAEETKMSKIKERGSLEPDKISRKAIHNHNLHNTLASRVTCYKFTCFHIYSAWNTTWPLLQNSSFHGQAAAIFTTSCAKKVSPPLCFPIPKSLSKGSRCTMVRNVKGKDDYKEGKGEKEWKTLNKCWLWNEYGGRSGNPITSVML